MRRCTLHVTHAQPLACVAPVMKPRCTAPRCTARVNGPEVLKRRVAAARRLASAKSATRVNSRQSPTRHSSAPCAQPASTKTDLAKTAASGARRICSRTSLASRRASAAITLALLVRRTRLAAAPTRVRASHARWAGSARRRRTRHGGRTQRATRVPRAAAVLQRAWLFARGATA